VLPIALALAYAAGPADLAPGAPELTAAERRLADLLSSAEAAQVAVARLQAEWTRRTPAKPPPPPRSGGSPGPCDDVERLEIGWRAERFGAAWRELAQSARAEAERVQRIRSMPTVSPLVDASWGERLDPLVERADHVSRALVEASAWQERYVRPALVVCPAAAALPAPGLDLARVPVRGEAPPKVAVLAVGDGVVCPGALRADDAVVLVDGVACWDASGTCTCVPEPVLPGAVLGPALPEPEPTPAEPGPGGSGTAPNP